MIGSIRGKLLEKNNKSVIIETNGIGYKINVSANTLNSIAHSTGREQKEKSV